MPFVGISPMSEPGHAFCSQSDKRRDTLAAVERLPIDPRPVVAVLQCPEGDADALIEALEASPALAARVVGVANSAGSRAIHKMESVQQCVRHLGAREARSAALSMALRQMAQGLEVDDGLLESLSASAARKAAAARLAADAIAPDRGDAAFTAGLLQDLALPMLAAHDAGYFQQQLLNGDPSRPWAEREVERFGIDHAELGAFLLRSWGVPATLAEAVRTHHTVLEDQPGQSSDEPLGLRLASGLAGLLPHLTEDLSRDQTRWLAAAHARFLADTFDTPGDFIAAAGEHAKDAGLCRSVVPPSAELLQTLVNTVTADTFALASRVSQLDRQVCEQTEHVVDLHREAMTDPLTGLLNRRGMGRFGEQSFQQATRAGRPVTCVMIDLDDFKPVNDTLGHDAGDRLLKAAAELLKTGVSSGDIVARLGGDEFALLLIGADQGQARAAVERLHASCNGREIPVGPGQKATLRMSIGGVHVPRVPQGMTAERLLEAADQLMYHCKRTGKAGLVFKATQKAA